MSDVVFKTRPVSGAVELTSVLNINRNQIEAIINIQLKIEHLIDVSMSAHVSSHNNLPRQTSAKMHIKGNKRESHKVKNLVPNTIPSIYKAKQT